MRAPDARTRPPGAPPEPSPTAVRFTSEGRLAVSMLAAFALAAWLLGDNLVFGLFALLLGACAVARRLAGRNVEGLSVRRSLPARTRVGRPTPLAYEVENERRRPAVGIELEDRPGRGIKPLVLFLELPIVRPAAPTRIETRVTFARRGAFALHTLALQGRYPLGLVQARRRLRAPTEVLVHPAEGRLTGALRQRLRGRLPRETRPARVARGDEVLYGVREYRDGDDPRRIHWRTTARRGALTMTEWRQEVETEVFLVLGRARGAGAKALRRFERAVSVAATIWRAAPRERLRLRLLLGDGEEALPAEGPGALVRGLDRLARVPAQGRRHPEAAARRLGGGGGRRTLVYVATGPEPGLEAALRRAAGRGGDALLLRTDLRSIRRWVGGIA